MSFTLPPAASAACSARYAANAADTALAAAVRALAPSPGGAGVMLTAIALGIVAVALIFTGVILWQLARPLRRRCVYCGQRTDDPAGMCRDCFPF